MLPPFGHLVETFLANCLLASLRVWCDFMRLYHLNLWGLTSSQITVIPTAVNWLDYLLQACHALACEFKFERLVWLTFLAHHFHYFMTLLYLFISANYNWVKLLLLIWQWV